MKQLLINSAKSIYIHIPFCVKKCNYCNFISFSNISDYENVYINTLCDEIRAFGADNLIDTVYIGGGTPNLLDIKNIEQIISVLHECFAFSDDTEFTMEFNPKISDFAYVNAVNDLGINRISLGAQSFNDEILKTLGRIHSVQDTLNMIEILNKAGIDNYSLDLIYGVFGQTIDDLRHDLKMINSISPKHVSTYGLKIEKGTPFCSYPKDNLPNEDICADMYLLISDKLCHAGYQHYEISNFAKNTYRSRHNMVYWQNKEYYGFGVSAHGYLNGIRYKNADSIEKYIANPLMKEITSENSQKDVAEEYIFLGLRTSDGIDLNYLKNVFNLDLIADKNEFIKQITDSGHAVLDKNKLFLTEKGFLISNYIMSELI